MTISSSSHRSFLNGASLEPVPVNPNSQVAKFDFMLTFNHNPVSCDKRLTCFFVSSNDIFEPSTCTQMGQRFQCLFERLFDLQSNGVQMGGSNMLVGRMSVILSEEYNEVAEMCLDKVSDIIYEGLCDNRIFFKLVLICA
ncbi:unnamed protein product [Adineta ricciae]|nr:unnamed protein product [Adineta ricciae]